MAHSFKGTQIVQDCVFGEAYVLSSTIKHIFSCVLLSSLVVAAANGLHAAEFAATGPTKEAKVPLEKSLGAVKITFDLHPTTMSFDLPWHFCSVTENGIKVAHFAAETYDPRNWGATGADASFEAGMDKEGRYALLVNPAFVVKNWNQPDTACRLKLDGKVLTKGTDYRFGFEQTAHGKDLVIWLNKTVDLNERDEHRAEIEIIPDISK